MVGRKGDWGWVEGDMGDGSWVLRRLNTRLLDNMQLPCGSMGSVGVLWIDVKVGNWWGCHISHRDLTV